MRSKTWFDEDLRVVRFRCSECMVAWGSRFGDYQQEDGDYIFCGLQDEQECEICGRNATGSCRLWAIRQVSGDSDGEVSLAVCGIEGIYQSRTPSKYKRKVYKKGVTSSRKTRGGV